MYYFIYFNLSLGFFPLPCPKGSAAAGHRNPEQALPIAFGLPLSRVAFGVGKGRAAAAPLDSYLLLPHSLRSLCKAFNISVSKGYFPFGIGDINYIGPFPKFSDWKLDQLTYDQLKEGYGKRLWNFKTESIKYCKLDCEALHKLLNKFNELIYKEFSIDIHSILTLPSLALRIFKTHYMKEKSVYQITGDVEANIRQAYSGGAVDVYIPDRKSTRLNSSHSGESRMPSSA